MPNDLWPHQQRIIERLSEAREAGYKRCCVSSATGTGKSRVMYELLLEAARRGRKAIVYCNRRMLFDQLCSGLYDMGVSYGPRAAGYRPALSRDIQIAMVQTERSKVLQDEVRELHPADLVLVDEAHLMANGAAKAILSQHHQQRADIIGFSATPVGIGHLYDLMVHGATPSEGRTCGALVEAKCYEPDRPDLKYIKRTKVGEEKIDGKWRPIWVKSIFGRVKDHWHELNPERKPTILFAPGVKESLWFAKELFVRGVAAAHIDAKGVFVDGKWHPGEQRRQEVMERIASNDLEVLCNRFVLREAVDCPALAHCILATRFGSESTYIQAVGRVLRNHSSLAGYVVVQDHGGNCHEFGSPNQDREWMLWDTAANRDYIRREQMRSNEIVEPFTCPRCKAMRRSGAICPQCGYTCDQRTVEVVQVDGSLSLQDGKVYRPKRRANDSYIKLWESCYWAARRKNRTFCQAINAFGYRMQQQHNYRAMPNPDWPLMPLRISDHVRRVVDVPFDRLVHKKDSGDVQLKDQKRQAGLPISRGNAAKSRTLP